MSDRLPAVDDSEKVIENSTPITVSPVAQAAEKHPAVAAFDQLVVSRTAWIETFLKPWCREAPRLALLRAEQEWTDIAGKVDPAVSLWLWAWSRFAGLHVDGLRGLDESYPIRVLLHDGSARSGYPDSLASRYGRLVLVPVDSTAEPLEPVSIDDIARIEPA